MAIGSRQYIGDEVWASKTGCAAFCEPRRAGSKPNDALTRQRTDGALVRLITPVYADEDVGDADQRLVSFTREIVPILSEFLPQ